ncbi:hypothetical protein V8C86DRAFT_3134197 [Haematococcus lacustris]
MRVAPPSLPHIAASIAVMTTTLWTCVSRPRMLEMSWSPRSVALVCHELHWLHSQLRHCCDVAGRLSCRVTLAGSCRRHTLTIARAQTALASHSSHLPLVSLCSSPFYQIIPCSRRTTTSVRANQQDASGVAHPADAAGAVPGDAGHHPAHHHVRDHGPAVLAHHRASVHHHQAPQHRAVLPSVPGGGSSRHPSGRHPGIPV